VVLLLLLVVLGELTVDPGELLTLVDPGEFTLMIPELLNDESLLTMVVLLLLVTELSDASTLIVFPEMVFPELVLPELVFPEFVLPELEMLMFVLPEFVLPELVFVTELLMLVLFTLLFVTELLIEVELL